MTLSEELCLCILPNSLSTIRRNSVFKELRVRRSAVTYEEIGYVLERFVVCIIGESFLLCLSVL